MNTTSGPCPETLDRRVSDYQAFDQRLIRQQARPRRVYLRNSRDEMEHSIERQRGQVEPYVTRKGYEVVQTYKDEGISGWKEGIDRPGFTRMLADAKRGQFAVIVVDDIDRFGRFDPITYGSVAAPLRDAGVRLETVRDGLVDWDDTLSQLIESMKMAFRKEESSTTSRRILTRFIQMAREGKWTNGVPPYGYIKDKKTGKLALGSPEHRERVDGLQDLRRPRR